MNIIVNIITGIVALLHIGFLAIEMFLWDKPTGQNIFRTTADFAAQSKTLAANQGLYNGFLAAGLIWGLFAGDAVKIFFLSYGTRNRFMKKIFFLLLFLLPNRPGHVDPASGRPRRASAGRQNRRSALELPVRIGPERDHHPLDGDVPAPAGDVG